MSGKNVWEIFNEETPKVAESWMNLSKEINIDGVLDQKTMYLIRIGIYAVTRDPVALRHFVREALKAGVSKKEIQAAALMAWGTGVTVAELAIPLIKEVEKSLDPTRLV
jgi:alkylhydroperoxidase/carboxymuconolactone decarboxylase family protein YurZ